MEMTLEGSNSAETFPPGVGGVRLHRGKIREGVHLSDSRLFFWILENPDWVDILFYYRI